MLKLMQTFNLITLNCTFLTPTITLYQIYPPSQQSEQERERHPRRATTAQHIHNSELSSDISYKKV